MQNAITKISIRQIVITPTWKESGRFFVALLFDRITSALCLMSSTIFFIDPDLCIGICPRWEGIIEKTNPIPELWKLKIK